MSETKYFKPKGHLILETVTAQREQFFSLLHSNSIEKIYCDLSEVQLCDSAGLAFLIDVTRQCRKQNRCLVFEHISEGIFALAKLYGVDSILGSIEQ